MASSSVLTATGPRSGRRAGGWWCGCHRRCTGRASSPPKPPAGSSGAALPPQPPTSGRSSATGVSPGWLRTNVVPSAGDSDRTGGEGPGGRLAQRRGHGESPGRCAGPAVHRHHIQVPRVVDTASRREGEGCPGRPGPGSGTWAWTRSVLRLGGVGGRRGTLRRPEMVDLLEGEDRRNYGRTSTRHPLPRVATATSLAARRQARAAASPDTGCRRDGEDGQDGFSGSADAGGHLRLVDFWSRSRRRRRTATGGRRRPTIEADGWVTGSSGR